MLLTDSAPVLDSPNLEERVILYNVTWEILESLDATLEGTGARLTYLDGILEIMSPLSEAHEDSKTTLAMILEAYLRVKQIRFYGRGSRTIGQKVDKTRREPDESYDFETKKPIPDLILEITVTSGGINKLAIYKRLGVPEVWFWEDGAIAVYCLEESGYQKESQSRLLPKLDLELLARCSRMTDQYDAVNLFLDELRSSNEPLKA